MSESSVIHDIGYQRYTGPRLGRQFLHGHPFRHGHDDFMDQFAARRADAGATNDLAGFRVA